MKTYIRSEPPIACNLTAIDVAQRERHRMVVKQLGTVKQETQELSDGYAFRFAAESSLCLLVAEFITLERLCCPFFTFVLEVEAEGGPLWLRMTGREGVKQFIQQMFLTAEQ